MCEACESFLVGAIIGVMMVFGGTYLTWWNESNLVCTGDSYGKAAKEVVDYQQSSSGGISSSTFLGSTSSKTNNTFSAPCDPRNKRGEFIHLECPVDDGLSTAVPSMGLVANGAYELSFEVEQFGYIRQGEKYTTYRADGNKQSKTCYCYRKTWTKDPVSSYDGSTICSKCKSDKIDFPPVPDGNTPTTMVGSVDVYADRVVMGKGAFVIGQDQVKHIASKPVIPLNGKLPSLTQSGWNKTGFCEANVPCYYKSMCNTTSPCLGDRRMTIVAHGSTYLSAVGREAPLGGPPVELLPQSFGGSTIPPCNSRSIFYVSDGLKSADELFEELHQTLVTFTQIMRIVSLLCLCLGFYCCLMPIEVMTGVIPCIGEFLEPMVGCILLTFSVAMAVAIWTMVFSLAWVFYRPLIGIPLFCLSIGALYLAFMAQRKAKKDNKFRKSQNYSEEFNDEETTKFANYGSSDPPVVTATPVYTY